MNSRSLKINKPQLNDSTPSRSGYRSTSSPVSIRCNTQTIHNQFKELDEKKAIEIIADMPKDVGWFLLIGGLATEFGVPAVPPIWIAGIMILWPSVGQRFSAPLQRRAPKSFNGCVRMLCRYVYDLEQRYPRHTK